MSFLHLQRPREPEDLREPQHTPGAYPRPPQNPKWKEFLHKLLVLGLGYVPGVCWKILREDQRQLCCIETPAASSPISAPTSEDILETTWPQEMVIFTVFFRGMKYCPVLWGLLHTPNIRILSLNNQLLVNGTRWHCRITIFKRKYIFKWWVSIAMLVFGGVVSG